jgi:hypothetical protein
MELFLLSSLTFNIVITAAIALFMFVYFYKMRSRAVLAWGIGWAIYAVSLAFDMWAVFLGVPTGALNTYPHLAFIRFVTAGIAFSFWYLGISLLVFDKKMLQEQLTGWIMGGAALWAYVSIYVLQNFFMLTFGIYSLLSFAVLLWTASCFSKYRAIDRSLGPVILITGAVGLAFAQAAYPFLCYNTQMAPFMFALFASFKTLIAAGFLLVVSNVTKIVEQRKSGKKK